jgi:hypothetical protein
MMRSEAIGIIKRGLGFRQTQDTAIIAALQMAQRDLEAGKTLPSWLLTFDMAVPVTAGVPAVTLPADFLRLHDDYNTYYLNSDGARVFVPRKNYTEAYTAYVASGRENDEIDEPGNGGFPSVIVIQSRTTAILVPTPTVAFTLYLTYYHAGQLLAAEIENEWLANAANYLIGLAGMSVAGDLRDGGALQRFTSMARLGGQGYMGEVVEQELAGRPLIMGRDN